MNALRFWDDPVWVGRTPIVASLLIDGGAVGQIVRMWRERSAEGQSLLSWCAVVVALLLWANFYRVITPDQRWARLAIGVSIVLNGAVALSVLWWRR